MRDIKFKFLLQDKNEEVLTEAYFLGDLIAPDGYIDVVSEYSADSIIKELPYTGLKDKNEVEIFESDVVDYMGTVGVITFSGGTYRFDFKTPYKDGEELYSRLFSTDMLKSQLEVIGNIYENKELLC